MTDDDEFFVRELVDALPILRSALDSHLYYYDEVLSHVFFGEVSQWALATCASAPDAPDLTTFLRFLEQGRATGSADIQDLIDQSFLENICGEEQVAAVLPPLLRSRYQEICGESTGQSRD